MASYVTDKYFKNLFPSEYKGTRVGRAPLESTHDVTVLHLLSEKRPREEQTSKIKLQVESVKIFVEFL